MRINQLSQSRSWKSSIKAAPHSKQTRQAQRTEDTSRVSREALEKHADGDRSHGLLQSLKSAYESVSVKSNTGEVKAKPRLKAGSSGKVSHPSKTASTAEKYRHYSKIIKAQLAKRGLKFDPKKTYVLGLRGLDPNGKRNPTTVNGANLKGEKFRDSFVVLSNKRGRPSAKVFRGASYPGYRNHKQTPRAGTGLLKPGVYRVAPRERRFITGYAFRVKNKTGSTQGDPATRDGSMRFRRVSTFIRRHGVAGSSHSGRQYAVYTKATLSKNSLCGLVRRRQRQPLPIL